MLIENKIKSHKQKFGVEVYAAMISSDREATERLFNEIKLFVEHQEAEINNKRMEIMSIKDGGGATPVQGALVKADGTTGESAESPSEASGRKMPWRRFLDASQRKTRMDAPRSGAFKMALTTEA